MLSSFFTLLPFYGLATAATFGAFTFDDNAPIPTFPFPFASDKLIDFSTAGYRALSAPIPSTPSARITLRSTKDKRDRTNDIQKAIDQVGASGGGVVRLQAGVYYLSPKTAQTIRITKANVILTGDGGDTILYPTGPNRTIFSIGTGANGAYYWTTKSSPITNKYMSLGSRTVSVADASLFKPGDQVTVTRQVTEKWLKAMGMDDLERYGVPQTWLADGSLVGHDRLVESRSLTDNTLTLDAPLTEGYSCTTYGGDRRVTVIERGPRTRESAVQSLRINMQQSQSGIPFTSPAMSVFMIDGAEDVWVKNIKMEGFLQPVYVGVNARRITLDQIAINRNRPTYTLVGQSNAVPADIQVFGSQVLVKRCSTSGDRTTKVHSVSIQGARGPNVIYKHKTNTSHTAHFIETHQRYATGLLVDSCDVGNVETVNRQNLGTGHGITADYSLHYNTRAREFSCQSPPVGSNLIMGLVGTPGTKYGNTCRAVTPAGRRAPSSLLLAQLTKRYGKKRAEEILS